MTVVVGKILVNGCSNYSTDSLSLLRRGIDVAPENRVGFFRSLGKKKVEHSDNEECVVYKRAIRTHAEE